MKLLVIRHAATVWNESRRLQGRRDLPLSAGGLAAASSWRLPLWAADWPLLTSPLRRTQQTAQALGRHGRSVAWLIEMDWGRWEGRRLSDLRRDLGAGMEAMEARGLDLKPPGGESPRVVALRLRPFLSLLARESGDRILVTHKGVIRAMLSLATGWDMTQSWPEKLKAGCGHLFEIEASGLLHLQRLNVELVW